MAYRFWICPKCGGENGGRLGGPFPDWVIPHRTRTCSHCGYVVHRGGTNWPEIPDSEKRQIFFQNVFRYAWPIPLVILVFSGVAFGLPSAKGGTPLTMSNFLDVMRLLIAAFSSALILSTIYVGILTRVGSPPLSKADYFIGPLSWFFVVPWWWILVFIISCIVVYSLKIRPPFPK